MGTWLPVADWRNEVRGYIGRGAPESVLERYKMRIEAARRLLQQETKALHVVERMQKETLIRWPDVTGRVRVIAGSFKGRFTVRDVLEQLRNDGHVDVNPKTIANSLARIVDRSQGVEVVDQGAGRRPTKYQALACVPES